MPAGSEIAKGDPATDAGDDSTAVAAGVESVTEAASIVEDDDSAS